MEQPEHVRDVLAKQAESGGWIRVCHGLSARLLDRMDPHDSVCVEMAAEVNGVGRLYVLRGSELTRLQPVLEAYWDYERAKGGQE